jgi:cation diffusion facilitator family transporter
VKGRRLGVAEQAATWMGIAGNLVLFAAKILVGFSYNSIAIISDSFNSLTDIVASTIVLISVRSSYRGPDANHPFGHARAQPLAGLVVAILTGIVGFEIITQSFGRLFGGARIQPGILPVILLAGVMVMKLAMYIVARVTAQKTRSTALMASAIDHRNDVLISAAVILGVSASNMGFPIFDPLAAIAVGTWIIWSGFRIGRDNMKFLMGSAPPRELVQRIMAIAHATEGVLGLNDVFAHYVGTKVEIEVHINVDKRLTIEQAHAIGKKVQWTIEDMDEISRAFIHIDPLETRAGDGGRSEAAQKA